MPNNQPLNQTVSGEIRAHMARQQRTQADLAATLGLSQGQVSQRLHGRIVWSVDEVGAVAAWLHVSPAELIGDAA